MRVLRLLFPIYFRRLRWEIGGWWLLSGCLSLLLLSDRGLNTLDGLSQAEIIVALWMTLRLALIDDAFGTLAGRHWRPVRGREILAARLLLVLVTFLPPVIFRAIVWQHWAMPDAGLWRDYLSAAGGWLFRLLLAGAAIQLVSALNRWAFKRGRKTATVVIAVLSGFFLLRKGMIPDWRDRTDYRADPSFGFLEEGEATRGILALLPKHPLLLGDWNTPGRPDSYLPMRELLRLPLREGRITIEPGVEALIGKTGLSGWRLGFEVRIRCRDQASALKYRAAIPVMHFRDGHYSDAGMSRGTGSSLPCHWPRCMKCRSILP